MLWAGTFAVFSDLILLAFGKIKAEWPLGLNKHLQLEVASPSVPVSYMCGNQSYTHELNELWEHLQVWNKWFLWAGRKSRLLPWQLLNSVLTFSHRQRPVTTLQPVCQRRLVPCLLASSGMGDFICVLFTLRLTQWCSPRQRGLCSTVQEQRTLD